MSDSSVPESCKTCSEPLEPNARFCAGCGTTTDPLPTPPPRPEVRRVGRDRKHDSGPRSTERPNDLKSWIAIVLAPLSVFTCGPLMSIPGAILAGLQLHAIKSGRSAGSSPTLAHFGLWGNVAATVAGVAMMCLSVGFMGLLFV